MKRRTDNLNNVEGIDSENCSVCKELLANIERFFDMLETARKSTASDWLTVDDIAKELKISKSIVYRLVRNREIQAINVTPNTDKFPQKGHYRIKRESLDNYLQAKKVNPLPDKFTSSHQSRRLYQVKNHLGL